MNTKQVADLLGVVPNTIRRLAGEFHRYLSGSASPPKGEVRLFDDHDLRVLHYIQAERDLGRPYETIHARLQAMQAGDWADLPDTPGEWKIPREIVPAIEAAAQAREQTLLAVMQRDLDHAQQQLEAAHQRVLALEADNERLRASQTATEAEKADMRLELERARGEVATLQARLSAYAITGGDRPLPVALIILVSALAVAVLVIVLLIVVRLVL